MSGELSWLDRARKLVAYHQEALEFISRVGRELSASRADAPAVSRLWAEADELDSLACALLDEMNRGLLDAAGEVDTTRGASLRATGPDGDTLLYDCSWSLLWGNGCGVSVNLAIEPRSTVFQLQVRARRTATTQALRFPAKEADLKEGLITAYLEEVTFEGQADLSPGEAGPR